MAIKIWYLYTEDFTSYVKFYQNCSAGGLN